MSDGAASGEPDLLGRIDALAIATFSEEIERERRLPPRLLAGMIEAGLFRMLVPRALGGLELDPLSFLTVMERVARADGSTAWCLGQNAVCGLIAGFLPPDSADAIFGRNPATILAWGAGPSGRARVTPGGYSVTGTWAFASGGRHANWLGGHSIVEEPDGAIRRDGNGAPVMRTMLFPAAAAEWVDDWQVIGLRGTGSDRYTVKDLFVAEAFSVARDDEAERRHRAPLYAIGTNMLFPPGFASLALGLARGMLDALIELAASKTPRGQRSAMRDSPVTQTEIAEMEARLRAARFYLRGTMEEAWREVQRTDRLATPRRVDIRLAATHVIQEAMRVADAAYHAAGATAIFTSNPFERRFRDMHAAAQQIQGRRTHFETVGRYLLGLDVDLTFL